MTRTSWNQTKSKLTEIVVGLSLMELEQAFQSKEIYDYTDDGWVLTKDCYWIPEKQWKDSKKNVSAK
jgi:hypothetical protein